MLLALLRKLPQLDASVRRGQWATQAVAPPLPPFAETAVGFLGFGRIARGVQARLKPFGFRFLAHDPALNAADGSAMPEAGVEAVDLATLLARADALSLHAPATPQTQGILSAANLARMKPTAVVVNAARGELIDAAALAAALTAGRLGGAALDVFPQEPLPADSPLRRAPNTLLTPHAAWYSDAAVERLQRLVADEIGRALDGLSPRRPIPGTAP
jgi:D-3-phosphoglycerate dehydrogenase